MNASLFMGRAAMPHFSPVILKRRGGFSGTSKRPPLCALDPEMTMGGPQGVRVSGVGAIRYAREAIQTK